jgi:hypothetical protein
MNKQSILKIAGVKSDKEFYKLFPNTPEGEEAFMAKYGKEFKKAQTGAAIDKAQFGTLLPTDIEMPSNIPSNPNYGAAQQKANDLYKYSSQFDVIGDPLNAYELSSASEDLGSKMPGAQQIIGATTGIMDAASAFKEQKKKLQGLRQQRGVADVSLKAAESIDVDARRQQSENMAKQRNAMMQPATGEERANVLGSGTNILSGRNGRRLKGGEMIGGNPTEIQNTFAPYDIYTDSGYEPLDDSNIKQYAQGGQFSSFMGAGGTDFANKAVGKAFNNNAGYQMGSAVGGALEMIPGIGTVASKLAKPVLGAVGGIADNVIGDAGKIKGEQRGLDRSLMGIQNAGMAKQTTGFLNNMGVGKDGINLQNYEDGGWVSHDWTPQVIASFGEHKLSDLLEPPYDADMLRAGGHLREYTPPSNRAMETYEDGGEIQSYGLGGELQTHWGGGAETISRNPYLPGTGETVMFRGKSHEEYSPNGETGIGVTYGGNPVEVERGEPMVELEEGGTIDPETGEVQKSGVVFGNLQIPNQYIDMLGDKNAKGKKFKNYVADLSKIEEKQNTIIDKSSKQLNDLDPINSFDKLKLTALQANVQGANMKLKEIADKKINAASLQNAINDTAEERGLVADDLARGKVKIDKKAQKQSAKFGGKFTKAQMGWYSNNPVAGSPEYGQNSTDWDLGDLSEVVIQRKKKSKYPQGIIEPDNEYDDYVRKIDSDVVSNKETSTKSDKKSDWWEKASLFANAALPYFRPSDVEDLDASQLYPEMFAMATNQVAPVQAQTFQPDLATPYDVSFQDQLNATQADYRAAQRMMGYNPAAQANLNAQKYQANQSVLANQFRANQEIKDKVYGENRNMLNQAKLQNLGIFDKQYERQTGALANTKATTQAALNSISDKYAKNKLENRTLQTYENMYNYRFGDNFRAQNMNPLAQFDTQYKGASAEELEAMAVLKKAQDKKEAAAAKKDKAVSRNGSIVKSYKNI